MSLIHYLGETYYVPEHVIKNYAHIYCDDDFGYKTAYYYTRGKKKKIVTKEQQKADYTVSKLAKYEDDTFYKLTNESKHSKVFDYFIKLKAHCPPNLYVGTTEHKKVLKSKMDELKNQEKKVCVRFE